MCYSQPVSICFAILGMLTTYNCYKNEKLRKLYIHITAGFYTIMELSQAIEYSFVNQCDNIINTRYLSELAYILVIVQPLMHHMVSYKLVRNDQDRRIFSLSLSMYAVWLLFNVYSRIAYKEGVNDDVQGVWSYLHNDKTCILRDNNNTHLYWQWSFLNMKDYNANFLNYLMIWFIPPLFVKSERASYLIQWFTFIVGTYLTYLSGRWREHASIWCYVSIPSFVICFINFRFIRYYFKKVY